MNRWLRLSFFAVAAVSGASALLFALLGCLSGPIDEFAVYGHPAQPWALDVHVQSSVALTLVLGSLLAVHVLPRFATERRARISGSVLIVLAALMLASGALLSCCAEEDLRELVAWTHGLSGSGFVLAVPWHVLLARRARARDAATPPSRERIRATAGSGAHRLRAPGSRLRRASRGRDGGFR